MKLPIPSRHELEDCHDMVAGQLMDAVQGLERRGAVTQEYATRLMDMVDTSFVPRVNSQGVVEVPDEHQDSDTLAILPARVGACITLGLSFRDQTDYQTERSLSTLKLHPATRLRNSHSLLDTRRFPIGILSNAIQSTVSGGSVLPHGGRPVSHNGANAWALGGAINMLSERGTLVAAGRPLVAIAVDAETSDGEASVTVNTESAVVALERAASLVDRPVRSLTMRPYTAAQALLAQIMPIARTYQMGDTFGPQFSGDISPYPEYTISSDPFHGAWHVQADRTAYQPSPMSEVLIDGDYPTSF